MRFLIYIIVCVAVVWIADMFFFKSRYRNEIWRDMEIEAQKINYEVRRAVRF
jgi:purine-cytosine permease-like protein